MRRHRHRERHDGLPHRGRPIPDSRRGRAGWTRLRPELRDLRGFAVTAPETRRPFDWEGAGQRLGESFDSYHAIVVAGNDPVITGRVAIGIGRAQAKHRRTACLLYTSDAADERSSVDLG